MALAEVTRLRLVQLRVAVDFSGLYALALGGRFWYVARQAGAGRLSLGDLALYLNAVVQAQSLGLWMRVWFVRIYEAMLHLRSFFHFLDSARPANRLPAPGQGRQMPPALRQSLELRSVAFGYPESDGPCWRT